MKSKGRITHDGRGQMIKLHFPERGGESNEKGGGWRNGLRRELILGQPWSCRAGKERRCVPHIKCTDAIYKSNLLKYSVHTPNLVSR